MHDRNLSHGNGNQLKQKLYLSKIHWDPAPALVTTHRDRRRRLELPEMEEDEA